MKTGIAFCSRIAATAMLLMMFAAQTDAAGDDEQGSDVEITILYDAFGKHAGMRKDWGFAALIEYRGKRILFDTGNNPDTLSHNAKAAGVDLSRLDLVIMSHRHGDHMGGMTHLLKVNPDVPIYAPKENFGVYGFSLPSSFYRKEPSLPPEERYYGGAPPAVMEFGSAWPGANIKQVESTIEISPGLHLIALVSDKPTTLELRELSLAIDTPDGLVIVVGCSHPGLENILEAAISINPRIRLIAGGFHLVVAPDEHIAKLVSNLRHKWRVAYVAPGHCTGEPSFAALKRAFGERYRYAGVGSTIVSGVAPTAKAEPDSAGRSGGT